MFENLKDTSFLQGAILSAAKIKGSLFGCDAFEDALNLVSCSVKNIISQNSEGTSEEKENIKLQLHIDKRLHAAVFYTALRSHGLTSQAADTFYSSIAGIWPEIDLKFYVELNFRCDWSEHFIKCGSQLPSEILHKVLKIIHSFPYSQPVEIYSWHLILQTLVLKLLEVPYDNEIGSSFHFDFTEEDSQLSETENSEIIEKDLEVSDADLLNKKPQNEMSLLKDMYNSLCNCLSAEINKSNDVNLIKVLLHGARRLLKSLITERERNYENILKFVDFLNIYNMLNDYLKLDSCQEILKAAMQCCAVETVKHSYATTSWNISESYLCFLLSYYWNKVDSDFCFKIELSTRSFLVYSQMINDNLLYKTLNALNPLCKSSEIDDKHLKFLHKILKLNFEGASFVAELLLLEPALIERNNTVKILEEKSHVIDFMKMYPIILQSVKTVKSQDLKFKLLNIFYKMLPVDNFRIYNDVLITILTKHGYTEEFQPSDFSEKLSQFFRLTPTMKEAEETLPIMFIQNPLVLLKRVIDQTLIQGPEGRPYIEPLKHVQFACTFQENKDAMPALIGILYNYFEKSKLEPWESKNMVTLYKFLMKIQSKKTHIMVLDVFFDRCIIPKLQYGIDNIELILDCVCVSLTILLQSKSFFIGHETLMSFIVSLGKLINDCIVDENARLKALVLPVIQVLDIHQLASGDIKDGDKIKLQSSFQTLHEGVFVYMKEFLPWDIEFSSKSFVWTSCCKNKDSILFEQQISIKTPSQCVLLCTLVEVLPHLTKEEWMYSVDLVKICCKNYVLRDEILCSMNKPFHLSEKELDLYAVASCFIMSLHFILQEPKDPAYIISCFANCLMDILKQEETENTCLLMTVLLDCSHLIECVSPDISSLIVLILLDLKKCIIASCSEETCKKDCTELISYAVKCLPDFCDKTVLLSS